ncbi:hypothetical protein HYDPIDRAFT_29324 [Hydnomerulius pinastri MD-312]|uniref:Unplaced genomic scaffold scaffold_16, whole genome shotgun sequence n=1 Tax=Hydnomerulius pinastri MD-312 TaxID=994086 RepID=A0A0C9W810_9AGAM|nr:hypothetical protein HYDPIDRAFT_29324 [Hydnomerulius pinastri MD-312]
METPTSTERVWLITGTSSGFGKRLVPSVLARGDYVIATARSLSTLGFPPSTHLRLLTLDITSGLQSISQTITEAIAIWGRIDVLVNNAGYGEKALIEEGGSDAFRRQFETNVFGLIDVTVAVVPYMRERREGVVVNMGSRTSWMAETPGGGPYAASKAVVRSFSETLAIELASFSIRVVLVEPAAFRTEQIFAHPYFTDNPISAYDALRARSQSIYENIDGKQRGDPVKAMELVVDVVRGEGKARRRVKEEGKEGVEYLPLGRECVEAISGKFKRLEGVLEEWGEVIVDTEFQVDVKA